MNAKPEAEDDEKEAERRFQETLGRLVNTPHKPHAPLTPKPEKRPAKKAASVSDSAEYQALRTAVLAAQVVP